jgi:phytoene dehydrogenase-like protein
MDKALRIAVIGAGPSGLMAAHYLRRDGHKVALFEAHRKPGGCASFFHRRIGEHRVAFDAGATVLNALHAGGYLHNELKELGIDLDAAFEPMEKMRYCIGKKPFELDCQSTQAFISSLASAFPQDSQAIVRLGPSWVACAKGLSAAIENGARLPIEDLSDLKANMRCLPWLWPALQPFIKSHIVDFKSYLKSQGLSDSFLRWVDMQCLITLQARSHEVRPLWGLMAILFYPMGTGALHGGMKSLMQSLLDSLEQGDRAIPVYMGHKVDSIELNASGKFELKLSHKVGRDYHGGLMMGPFDICVSSAPRYNTAKLIGHRAFGHEPDFHAFRDKLWSALTAYFAVIDLGCFPDLAFNLHVKSTLGHEAYYSFSSRADKRRDCPPGQRLVTASTHIAPDTNKLDRNEVYKAQKNELGRMRLKDPLIEAYPELREPGAIPLEEYGSAQTFWRYTQREGGSVGGLPLDWEHSLWRSPSQRTRIHGLYQIGDTSFPGQSVYGGAIGAKIVAQRIRSLT